MSDDDRDHWGETSHYLEQMLADMFKHGTEIEYEELRLVRLDSYRNQWRVYSQDGELLDSLNLGAFRSVGQLGQWLNKIVEAQEVDDGER
ncbi:MAG: hypothetical protein ABEI98_08555 [Halorhabdus sp.]